MWSGFGSPSILSYQKKCKEQCWLHRFFWELIQKNIKSNIKIIKKYKNNYSDDFDYFLSDELVKGLPVEN